MTKNYFEVLNAVDVSKKIEKKNGLSYLSWAFAWGELKKLHPDATYNTKMFDGKPYIYDENLGYMVFTDMTINGITHEMWLPVMDGANQAMKAHPYTVKTKYKEITVAAATMFDINKTLMRCFVKNIAMFGLGLYIYAGEDLPEETSDTKAAAALGGSMMDNTDRSQQEAFHGAALRLLDQCAEMSALEAVWKKNYKGWSKLPQDLFEDIEQKKNEVKQELESKL